MPYKMKGGPGNGRRPNDTYGRQAAKSKANRPKVDAASIARFTDHDKKHAATYGPGAKLQSYSSPTGQKQLAYAKAKSDQFKAKTGRYNYDTIEGIKKGKAAKAKWTKT